MTRISKSLLSLKFYFGLTLLLNLKNVSSRIHNFTINNIEDYRLPISTFGYDKNGELEATIHLTRTDAPLNSGNPPIGFTLDRSETIGGIKRMEQEEDLMDDLQPINKFLPCILDERESVIIQKLQDMNVKDTIERITFKIIFGESNEDTVRMEVWKTPFLNQGIEIVDRTGSTLSFETFSPEPLQDYTDEQSKSLGFTRTSYPLKFDNDGQGGTDYRKLQIKFTVRITEEEQGGLYELNFHNCHHNNQDDDAPELRPDFQIHIEVNEKNERSYLSSGKMLLPEAYFFMFILFSGATFVWYNVLVTNRSKTFRIHWLMGVLITVKSLSLMAHSIDYFYIDKDGTQHSWAVIFWIIHSIRAFLLFFTLALIATGWSFVKCVLSDNERRVFMIVLPLQVIANIAFVIIESSEEAQANYQYWQQIFTFVDLICCGAIMFPIIWSIRHLTMATASDGKGAVALKKLELFKKFYAWTIAYIYLTRIGGLLLDMALRYDFEWFSEVVKEFATFAYFVYTGYLFRPGSDQNPYIKLRQGDGDEEDKQTLLQSGAMEGLKKRTNLSRKIDSGSDDDSDEDDVVDTIALIRAANSPTSQV